MEHGVDVHGKDPAAKAALSSGSRREPDVVHAVKVEPGFNSDVVPGVGRELRSDDSALDQLGMKRIIHSPEVRRSSKEVEFVQMWNGLLGCLRGRDVPAFPRCRC